MKLTQKAVAALQLADGQDRCNRLRRRDARLRLSAAPRCWRQGVALMGLPVSPWRVPPAGCCSVRPTVLGAEQARTMAKKALGRVANGEDPQADKLDRRGKDRHTFKAVVADYLAIKQREVRPRTYTELMRYLTGSVFRAVAQPRARSDHPQGRCQPVKPDQLGKQLDCGRGAPVRRCRAFYVWAMQAGIIEANPVVGTAKPKDGQSRDRVLADAELSASGRRAATTTTAAASGS